MLIVVSYDVPSDKRRTKLAHALEDFGTRVQLSVFECLLEEEQVVRMRRRIDGLVEAGEDSVRIYRLCGGCAPKVEIVGLGVISEDPDVYIV
jgi:CRISPR-associated protein Cas2